MNELLTMSPLSVFELQTATENHTRELALLVRHPGEAEYTWPLLPYLAALPDLRTVVMTADCASESIQAVTGVDLKPLSDGDVPVAGLAELCKPDLIFTGPGPKPGVYLGPDAVFPNTPYVFAEEYYGSAGFHLNHCLANGWRLPERWFTFDEFARQDLISRYGRAILDLASQVDVTGHPGFDYVANSALLERQRRAVRESMGLAETDRLIACFATVGATDVVGKFAQELAGMPDSWRPRDYKASSERPDDCEDTSKRTPTYVVFNAHPRDTVDVATYRGLFNAAGVPMRNGDGISSQQLIAAADMVVILPHSTLALHAVQQGKITFHYGSTPTGLGSHQILVRRGVSPYVMPGEFLPAAIKLADARSTRRQELLARMATTYPVSGEGASLTTEYIEKVLSEL